MCIIVRYGSTWNNSIFSFVPSHLAWRIGTQACCWVIRTWALPYLPLWAMPLLLWRREYWQANAPLQQVKFLASWIKKSIHKEKLNPTCIRNNLQCFKSIQSAEIGWLRCKIKTELSYAGKQKIDKRRRCRYISNSSIWLSSTGSWEQWVLLKF